MEIDYYKEQLEAKEEMLAQTTRFLMRTQSELENRNKDLSAVNRDIFDSIQFASMIQKSLLPELGVLKVYFKDAAYRVIQQIGIGGDNIFVKNTSHGILFGLFDSTGHGIPAALLSISGTVILKEMVYSMEISDPRYLLRLLNQQLYSIFNSTGYKMAQKEGLIFNYQSAKNKLSYCSAKGKAILLRNNSDLIRLEATKASIGEDPDTDFRLMELEIIPGDKLLIYSDGLNDQFGGPGNKKFGTQGLKQVLLSQCHLSATELATKIEADFRAWQGTNLQTDDVSFMIIDF